LEEVEVCGTADDGRELVLVLAITLASCLWWASSRLRMRNASGSSVDLVADSKSEAAS
jgi:hypothetical protein